MRRRKRQDGMRRRKRQDGMRRRKRQDETRRRKRGSTIGKRDETRRRRRDATRRRRRDATRRRRRDVTRRRRQDGMTRRQRRRRKDGMTRRRRRRRRGKMRGDNKTAATRGKTRRRASQPSSSFFVMTLHVPRHNPRDIQILFSEHVKQKSEVIILDRGCRCPSPSYSHLL
jgi:hypothetical protein